MICTWHGLNDKITYMKNASKGKETGLGGGGWRGGDVCYDKRRKKVFIYVHTKNYENLQVSSSLHKSNTTVEDQEYYSIG